VALGVFYRTLTEAVADITEHGFDSEARVHDWVERIRRAARDDLVPEARLTAELKRVLTSAYDRYVERGGILLRHQDIPRWTIDRVKPKLRSELDRRIMASAGLIKLNREQSKQKTVQRFVGWATSIPAGGSSVVERVPVKTEIRKALASLPFEERRVLIDQSHKLISAVSNIVATDGGAIAGVWNDHGHTDKSYNARPEHLKRTGKFFLIRDNWAQQAGLCKPGPDGYMDEIEAPGEFVGCRCFYRYVYAIRRLPEFMLTEKGKKALAERASVSINMPA